MKAKKDAYYFPHDCNAKDDPKCVLLIEQLGLEGYGIFWVLVETLREQPDFKYPLKLVPALARKHNTTTAKMKVVVKGYDLFIIEDNTFFFSASLNRRMQPYLEKKKALSEAGKKGNQVRWNKNIALQSGGDQEAIANKTNKNKTKEILLFKEAKEEEDLLKCNPPEDGVERNWNGLKNFLSQMNGSIKENNFIIKKSNFGEKGSPIWSFILEVRNSNGKIYTPIAFIISRLKES
ncbi:hypothetical protein M2459_002495 [Parabacteroides sp. PF5-5]|uniref:Lin1244/Lin1753 domain-containing protein n=1 Tax=unclassified Parabacteroides TaxID=2649774 RepID=UPI0024756932|nr:MULTISPECIES: Lin1244/Lin1753 domain-containing protein [unclassified Parabacteroides]MDH6305749.1 hypothetical protein [Parabacteroides sp. PH5-39]MDH6316821.1 hypothetical protein [Parabacteroides sp. PF5-13]MDH6320462.1 hypothetical protein [Parabacteroides sp. PH5-13]MDH6324192.1 hypothetical protein [Parabacteroides sp. PH5-8]MDH6328007.1 hypothetical protein [Parabacteroides sp. PH5-41]